MTTEPRSGRVGHFDRSGFWPAILVGIGLLLLLHNLGVLATGAVVGAFELWPVLLVAAGLDLIIRPRSLVSDAALGAVALGAALVAGFASPQASGELVSESFREPVGVATSLSASLAFASGSHAVTGQAGSQYLIEADIASYGGSSLSVTGDERRTLRIVQGGTTSGLFNWLISARPRADVRLNPDLPTDLSISIGSGSLGADLTALHLSSLVVSKGSGSGEVHLPVTPAGFTFQLRNGSGSTRIDVPAGSTGVLDFHTGSGSVRISAGADVGLSGALAIGSGGVTLDLAAGTPARIEVTAGSGSVNASSAFRWVRGDGRRGGTWETAGFQPDSRHVHLNVRMGSGSLTLR